MQIFMTYSKHAKKAISTPIHSTIPPQTHKCNQIAETNNTEKFTTIFPFQVHSLHFFGLACAAVQPLVALSPRLTVNLLDQLLSWSV